MAEIILSHWLTYVFLFWALMLAAINIWPRNNQRGRVEREAPTCLVEDEDEGCRRKG